MQGFEEGFLTSKQPCCTTDSRDSKQSCKSFCFNIYFYITFKSTTFFKIQNVYISLKHEEAIKISYLNIYLKIIACSKPNIVLESGICLCFFRSWVSVYTPSWL